MSLPFISYGGSALLAAAITVGFLLALSRQRAGQRVTIMPRAAAAGQT